MNGVKFNVKAFKIERHKELQDGRGEASTRRRDAVAEMKRSLILEAARDVFENEGLEGASLRAIAAKAGYTPAALYTHFASKEEIYAELLAQSLENLRSRVDAAIERRSGHAAKLRAAALAFFDFYAENPRDLDLGFYLFRGGMRPHGLGRDRDEALNNALEASLAPIGEAARTMGAREEEARRTMADVFAHAAGLLLLTHTHRIRMFGVTPRGAMEAYIDGVVHELGRDP